ncbi:MAG TPA: pilus assembly protein TadG-related protein [Acetobacteraceae bacterium]|jgi:Flp pilus assembly protein TadG
MLRSFIEPFRSRRASVALYVALLAPVLAMSVGLGVEVSSWSATKVNLQRIADTASAAGAINYKNVGNAQTAATAAAYLAQINGASGTSGATNPTWNSGTKTLSDNQISVAIVNGVQKASDTAVQVTVNQTVPLTISRIVSSTPSVTVSSTSTAEVVGVQGAGSGGQPCMVALSKTGNGIAASGSITLNSSGCTAVSNANFNDSGGSTLTIAGIYAVGTVTVPCWANLNGDSSNCPVWPPSGMIQTNSYLHPQATAISDPYASNTALQTDLSNASTATGKAISCSNQNCGLPAAAGSTFNGSYCGGQGTGTVYCYLKPGNYLGWAVTSGGPYYFCMAPGLYTFNGSINLTQNTTTADRTLTVNGTSITCPSGDSGGVTIVTSGTFNGANTFNFDVTAPNTSEAGSTGGIAGVVLASSTSTANGFTMSGNPQLWVTGVLYFPNTTFDSQGSTGLGTSSTSCLEIIAASITLTGSSNMSSGCTSVNAATFYSQPGATTYTAELVQ